MISPPPFLHLKRIYDFLNFSYFTLFIFFIRAEIVELDVKVTFDSFSINKNERAGVFRLHYNFHKINLSMGRKIYFNVAILINDLNGE